MGEVKVTKKYRCGALNAESYTGRGLGKTCKQFVSEPDERCYRHKGAPKSTLPATGSCPIGPLHLHTYNLERDECIWCGPNVLCKRIGAWVPIPNDNGLPTIERAWTTEPRYFLSHKVYGPGGEELECGAWRELLPECDACLGSGAVAVEPRGSRPQRETCEACGGSGRQAVKQ